MSTTHVVTQGEHLGRIAGQYGFCGGRAIYDHPANAELRRVRPNLNILLPGDVVAIPDPRTRVVNVATGKRHIFRLRAADVQLRVVLKGADDKPFAGLSYTLDVAGKLLKGQTDATGMLVARVPAEADAGLLTLGDGGPTVTIHIGHLDPIAQRDGTVLVTGLQARLNNLGFDAGAVDGELGPRTRAALQRFQRQVMGRDGAEGDPDDETIKAVVKAHGC